MTSHHQHGRGHRDCEHAPSLSWHLSQTRPRLPFSYGQLQQTQKHADINQADYLCRSFNSRVVLVHIIVVVAWSSRSVISCLVLSVVVSFAPISTKMLTSCLLCSDNRYMFNMFTSRLLVQRLVHWFVPLRVASVSHLWHFLSLRLIGVKWRFSHWSCIESHCIRNNAGIAPNDSNTTDAMLLLSFFFSSPIWPYAVVNYHHFLPIYDGFTLLTVHRQRGSHKQRLTESLSTLADSIADAVCVSSWA